MIAGIQTLGIAPGGGGIRRGIRQYLRKLESSKIINRNKLSYKAAMAARHDSSASAERRAQRATC